MLALNVRLNGKYWVNVTLPSGWWFVNLDDCNEGWVPATYLEPIYGTEEAQTEVLKPGEGMAWEPLLPGPITFHAVQHLHGLK